MRILRDLPLDGAGADVELVGTREMLHLLDLSPAGLSDLARREIAVKRGRDTYELAETVRRYIGNLREAAAGRGGDGAGALTAERARLAKEQADGQALKNAQARGELVRREDVEAEWSGIARLVRARIMAIPARLRAEGGLSAEAAEAVDVALRRALAELAEGGASDE